MAWCAESYATTEVSAVQTAQAWFQLFVTPGIGNKALWQLSEELSEPLRPSNPSDLDNDQTYGQTLCAQLSSTSLRHLVPTIRAHSFHRSNAQWRRLIQAGVQLMHPQKGHLPHRKDLPAVWFYWGQAPDWATPRVAIIGSRDTSLYVLEHTQNIAQQLSKQGAIVVSGFARGVDRHSHQGALYAQRNTWGVLPYGILHMEYKRWREKLGSAYATHPEGMSFMSQFYPYQPWHAACAIQRNRMICALADHVLVMASEVSSHKQSGSYQTGRIAWEMRKPLTVFMPKAKQHQSSGNVQLLRCPGVQCVDEHTIGDWIQARTTH